MCAEGRVREIHSHAVYGGVTLAYTETQAGVAEYTEQPPLCCGLGLNGEGVDCLLTYCPEFGIRPACMHRGKAIASFYATFGIRGSSQIDLFPRNIGTVDSFALSSQIKLLKYHWHTKKVNTKRRMVGKAEQTQLQVRPVQW